jgi:tetratricopeptide (TPR) repeat protein
MSESNSVFISYRRDVSAYIALAVFQDLHTNGIDVFYDIENIKAGQFPTIIANQIAARPYFISILTPGTLDCCINQDDWVRREIEHAIELQRLIIPLHTPEFSLADIDRFLSPEIAATLKTYNMVEVPHRYFKYAMQEVRSFLVPTQLETTPTPSAERKAVDQAVQQAIAEPAVTESQLTAQEYFERGRATDNLSEKIANYNKAIELDPDFGSAYSNRGFVYVAKGDYVSAIQDFTRALDLEPDDPVIYCVLGDAYRRQGEYEKAIEDFTTAIRLDPRIALAYAGRGQVHTNKGDYDTAIEDFTQAVHLDPYMITAYINRAFAHQQKGSYDNVIADCNKAIELDPAYALAYNNRGWAFYCKGNFDKAIEDCTQAIYLDPKCIPAYDSRAYAYAAKRDYVNAVANAKKALSVLEVNSKQAQALKAEMASWRELM